MSLLILIFPKTQKPIYIGSEDQEDLVILYLIIDFIILIGHLGLAINFITDDDKDNFMKIE